MHKVRRELESSERVAWVLDNVWPETASLVVASFGPGDQLIAPGIVGASPERYRWPVPGRHGAAIPTARRHVAMRRVAYSSGAIRQRTYLEHDRSLARALAGYLDYRARHVVVAQAWLPWLAEAGVLGGRTFDVVMSRYPLSEIHRLLDEAAAEIGSSATIADFRADLALVEREAELLAQARRIYTPHRGIAGMFPSQAVLLAWHKPVPVPARAGHRVAFLGPTIARQRPDIVRRLASRLPEPLVVFGPILEPFWDGCPIERRQMGANWLDDIGVILHPATLTHEPRALLQGRANGVIVHATAACGLNADEILPLELFGA